MTKISIEIKFSQIFETWNGAVVDVFNLIWFEVNPLEILIEFKNFCGKSFEVVVAERETFEFCEGFEVVGGNFFEAGAIYPKSFEIFKEIWKVEGEKINLEVIERSKKF